MKDVNIDEVPLLDCRYKENSKILIKLFNDMKPVKNKNLSYQNDFKNDLDNIEELNMIRVLAGLGLVIGEFTHEIMNYLGVFDIDTKYILSHVDRASEEY